jgi:hypothetical protein
MSIRLCATLVNADQMKFIGYGADTLAKLAGLSRCGVPVYGNTFYVTDKHALVELDGQIVDPSELVGSLVDMLVRVAPARGGKRKIHLVEMKLYV